MQAHSHQAEARPTHRDERERGYITAQSALGSTTAPYERKERHREHAEALAPVDGPEHILRHRQNPHDQHGERQGHGEFWLGAERPGHFRGVTTVVTKLFNAARPHVAVFGQKDFQQLAIIRRMTTDLDMAIEIVGLPTVRESDGLALSSRNRRLTDPQRVAAVCVPRALHAVRAAYAAGEDRADRLSAIGRAVVDAEPLARFEHLELVHQGTLQPAVVADDETVAVTAVWFGDVRLIDNLSLHTRT